MSELYHKQTDFPAGDVVLQMKCVQSKSLQGHVLHTINNIDNYFPNKGTISYYQWYTKSFYSGDCIVLANEKSNKVKRTSDSIHYVSAYRASHCLLGNKLKKALGLIMRKITIDYFMRQKIQTSWVLLQIVPLKCMSTCQFIKIHTRYTDLAMVILIW